MKTDSRGITIAYLRECFIPDYREGRLWWKNRPREHFNSDRGWWQWNGKFPGKQACITYDAATGYYECCINTHFKLRRGRTLLAMWLNRWPIAVHHKDFVRTNDRISNLQEKTVSKKALYRGMRENP